MEDSGLSARDIITGLLGVIVTLIAWVGARLHNRVDNLERDKANKNDVKEAVKELKEDFKEALDRQTKFLTQLIRGRLDD